jgi:hypothetical protein
MRLRIRGVVWCRGRRGVYFRGGVWCGGLGAGCDVGVK